MMMNIFAHAVLIGWFPLLIMLFAILPARLAVTTACVGAVLFLPMAGYPLPTGLPPYNKYTLGGFGVLIVAMLFDARRFMAFRPSIMDLFPVVLVIQSLISSLLVGNGPASIQSMINESMWWLFPYLLGRVYYSDLQGMRDLAVGLFVGGLVYLPFCVFELRFSPILHTMVYGFHQHTFAQSRRGDGWRPVVFMQHGLMVGLWMSMAALAGVWLWRSGCLRNWKTPIGFLIVLLLVVSVFCKSFGAMVLLGAGLVVLYLSKWVRGRWIVAIFLAMPIMYQVLRTTGVWNGGEFQSVIGMISPDRESSLGARLLAESQYTARALQRPLFGWGGWGDYRFDEKGDNLATVDGLWLYMLGKYGLIGLVSFNLMLAAPVLRFVKRFPARTWASPAVAPACAMMMVVLLYLIDNLFNAMINPVYILAAGGLASLKPPPMPAPGVGSPMQRPVQAQNERTRREAIPGRGAVVGPVSANGAVTDAKM